MYQLVLKAKDIEPVVIQLERYEKDLLSHDNMKVAKVYGDRDYELELVEISDGAREVGQPNGERNGHGNGQGSGQKISVAQWEESDLLTYKISHQQKGFKRPIRSFNIYVNEDKLDVYGTADNVVLVNKKIFADSFGFARITVEIQLADGTWESYFSEYVSIMVNDIETVNRINAMYEYIFDNEKELLFRQCVDGGPDGPGGSARKAPFERVNRRGVSGNSERHEDGVLVKLAIAEDLARLYENNFGYFRTNSRYKIKERYVVDDVEKLRNISSKTLDYIASHPEQLSPAAGNGGIKINGQGYFPKKTLVQENEISVDIYENRVLIGFLYRVIGELGEIKAKLDNLEANMPLGDNLSELMENGLKEEKYIHSAQFILAKTGTLVAEKQEKVHRLLDKFQGLVNMYNSVLNVSKVEVQTVPKPTAIFMSIPNYNVMFNGICRWFNGPTSTAAEAINRADGSGADKGGQVDSEDAFMLSFVNLSSLYELYALCQIIGQIKGKGYSLEYSEKYLYKVDQNLFYVNSECMNTFVFSNENGDQLTLYYQPIIYKGGHRNNRTGLYRNISLSFGENGYRGEYYVPDYVIKKTGADGKNQYAILDAKFMERKNVVYKIPELSYKYLFSLSPVMGDDRIEGLYVLYGKPGDGECEESAYDFEMEQNSIKPRVQLVPMG